MGKRSSVSAKNKHTHKRSMLAVLLDYSLKDKELFETVYTLENEAVIRDCTGWTPTRSDLQPGEVLVWANGESPLLQELSGQTIDVYPKNPEET